MLRLFVPPPGARRIAYEPAFYQPQAKQILGRNTWGLGPALSDKFARFAYWRVPASVAAVASFERAHRPAGSLTAGGYGGSTRTKTPRHGTSDITFAPIQRLVINRWMQVWILRLPSHQTAIRVAVSNGPWSPRSFRAALRAQQVFPIVTRQAPVAGRRFTGVEVIDVNPRIAPLQGVACNGVLENHPLPAVQHVSAIAPPAGWPADLARLERVSKVEAVTCTWQIPANAAGQQLRLGSPEEGTGVVVYTGNTPTHRGGAISTSPHWIVRP